MRALTIGMVLLAAAPVWADDVEARVGKAETLLAQGKTAEALDVLNDVLKPDSKQPRAYYLRGMVHERLDKYTEAIADYSRVLELDPKAVEAYNDRGSAHFKKGAIKESVADFDRYLEARPRQAPGHWRRGISLYYLDRFEDGARQFKAYETTDTNDVENAVWHFLCNARKNGVEKARQEILKIGKDERVPMSEVYDLYAGTKKPEDVLKAVEAGKPNPVQLNARLFYAHLYLGLYYEVSGDKKKAREHITTAADKHRIPHYMWDVARVHRDLLTKEKP